MNRICLIYSLYEKNSLYKKGIQCMLDNVILNDVDFYIVVNGQTSVTIPQGDNIFVFYRNNEGFDFGSHSFALKNLLHEYDLYFFANSSVCGPYLSNPQTKWYQPFIDCIGSAPDIHLVGTCIDTQDILYEPYIKNLEKYRNLYQKLHGEKRIYSYVCSMFFVMDEQALSFLNSINFFNEEECNGMTDLHEVISFKEVGMSQYLLNNGMNIGCLISPYRGIDFRECQVNLNWFDFGPANAGSYFTRDVSPEDVIFFKYNRYGFIPKV